MRVTVEWQTVETFIATLDVPDDEVADLWDGDNSTLVALEEPNALDDAGETTWAGLTREVNEVTPVGGE